MLTFLRFARAHTIVGTSLSLLALFLMAGRDVGNFDWATFFIALFSCLCANVYITGLNQLTDVEIDRINKPYLPLASGAYSLRTGRTIITLAGLLALGSCVLAWPYLTLTVVLSLLIGTAYSVEPLRLKRYHFWAAFCIIVVRGLIVNLLLYLHFRTALGGTPQLSAEVQLLTVIIFVFGIIIAWFKDLPDTEGDEAYGIRTLSLVKNRSWVFRLGSALLLLTFLSVAAFAFWNGSPALAAAHLGFAAAFFLFARRLDLTDQKSIAAFYQRVWVLFFLEYVVFACVG